MTIKIPGYKIERLLAEGGMATVYLATQESLGRYVALKLLKKFDNPNQQKRFLNEGRIIASLSHRNIITIHDIGVTDDELPYLSMEYLEGGDLEARIRKGTDTEDALRLLETVGDCLDFVHRKGIVHRDIKPANILFHKDGTPILSDFGVAKQEESDAKLTVDGSALGSPYYLSPEQAECKKLDGRADIYGLGIILYEMLTGTKPYKGDSHIEIIIAHLSDPLPILPPELHRYQPLIQKMIAKSPDDRFAGAGEMVRYVRRLRKSETDSLSSIPDDKPINSLSNIRIIGEARDKLRRLSAWLDDHLKKPQITKQQITWASAGVLATLLAIIGTLLLIQQPAVLSPTEHAPDPIAIGNAAAIKEVQNNRVGTEKADDEDPPDTAETQLQEPEILTGETLIPSSDNSQRIEGFLLQANAALEEYRLTTPKNNNAYYYYQQVLDLYPNHDEAIKGIDKIVDTYADLVEGELNRFHYETAKEYLYLGLMIHPDNQRLRQLQKDTNVFKDAPTRAFGKIKSLFN